MGFILPNRPTRPRENVGFEFIEQLKDDFLAIEPCACVLKCGEFFLRLVNVTKLVLRFQLSLL